MENLQELNPVTLEPVVVDDETRAELEATTLENVLVTKVVARIPVPKDGLIGPTGARGVQGLQGLTGLQGPKGTEGKTGLRGLDGLQGLQGERGLQGLTGLTGDAGKAGLQGAKGDRGLNGPKGDRGHKGDIGLRGPDGTKGLLWHGSWDSKTRYAIDDAVERAGSSYIAIRENINETPSTSNAWDILAKKGKKGDKGEPGRVGQKGPRGAPGYTHHGQLSGLLEDDHPQYHTDERGDARYVNITGDTMTGDLNVVANINVTGTLNAGETVITSNKYDLEKLTMIGL